MKISLFTPVNDSRYLAQTYGSLLAQGISDWEWIIVPNSAAKLGSIIVGRRGIVVGPQTTRNGIVAIDPHTTRGDEARYTNSGVSRFGRMLSCSGVRRSTESDQKA